MTTQASALKRHADRDAILNGSGVMPAHFGKKPLLFSSFAAWITKFLHKKDNYTYLRVSVSIVFEIVKTCFPHLLATTECRECVKEMIPTYNEDLENPQNEAPFLLMPAQTNAILGLNVT